MKNRKGEIIKVALKIVSERGYEWLSFQKVADKVGIAKSTIYHYFKNKEELGIAIVEVVEKREERQREVTLTYRSEKEKLDAYLTRLDIIETLHVEAIAKLSFDFKGLPINLQEKIRKHSINNHEFILGILKRGVENKEFNLKKDLEEVAMGIRLISIGSYIYGRIFDVRNIDVSKDIIDGLLN